MQKKSKFSKHYLEFAVVTEDIAINGRELWIDYSTSPVESHTVAKDSPPVWRFYEAA